MRHLIPALVVTIVGFSTASAQPAKAPFSNKSLGEGGGYKHPDADVGQFFEVKPKPEEAKKDEPAASAPAKVVALKVVAESRPAEAPARVRPRPFAPVLAQAEAPAGSSAPAAKKAPAAPAAADGAALDSASEDARRDYEARLFGAAPAPRRPELADPSFSPSLEPAGAASAGEGMLFVSLELDAQEAGSLRDAVAGLGVAAAFRPDARFQPMPGAAGAVRISGWLPASRLGDAIARPGVKRVEVERGASPAGDNRLSGPYIVKLRLADPARPEESIAEGVRTLTSATGFALERVLGVEKAPGGGSTALVSGTMPVSRLSRALGLSSVMSVVSAPPAAAAGDAPAAAGKPARKEGFLQYVMARSLWLVLITALLVLPVVSDAVKKGLAVFVPYR